VSGKKEHPRTIRHAKEMPGFVGKYQKRFPRNHRLHLPKEFKRIFEERGDDRFRFIIEPWERRIIICPEWALIDYVRERAKTQRLQQDEDFQRLYRWAPLPGRIDDDGRITFPKEVVEDSDFVGVEEVVLLGKSKWIEVWPKDEWESLLERVSKQNPPKVHE